jgi:hypothetical protein
MFTKLQGVCALCCGVIPITITSIEQLLLCEMKEKLEGMKKKSFYIVNERMTLIKRDNILMFV